MVLLSDKFKPKKFQDLSIHPSLTSELSRLSASGNEMPHLVFYGPNGSGKMTRVRVLLQELFDATVTKIKIDQKAFQTPSGKKIDVTVYSSNFHIEINPSDAGIYDRVVIQEIIKELAQTQQVDKSKRVFKVAVILEADRLSKDAQHALRRTMEKYSSNLRLILCCNTVGRIIGPIKSRCLLLRIPSVSDSELRLFLGKYVVSENMRLPEETLDKIVIDASGNLRKALLLLESASVNGKYENLDWQNHIARIVSDILKDQTPTSLLAIRPLIYELLAHCIPATIIIKTIFEQLSRNARLATSCSELIEIAAVYVLKIHPYF